jgi:hypothetical protein
VALALVVNCISICGMEEWAAGKQASKKVNVKKFIE